MPARRNGYLPRPDNPKSIILVGLATMDAAYLKKNVMVALTEALTSMAVKIPDDSIEYIGKYLLVYVQRQKEQAEANAKLQNVENELSEFLAAQANVTRAADEKNAERLTALAKYRRFLDSLDYDFTTKQAALDAVCEFIEGNLDIPAAYIAVKKSAGESEVLNYVSAGPSQQSVKGKKLPKPAADEGDEAPERQGVSFEAFKLPEVPEDEEPAEELEEDAPVVEKVPPKAQPLVVENVMRDKRVKFLNGVGKLGAFAAIPFSYPTILHEEGCVLGTVEEGSEVPADYEFNPKPSEFVICVDTVGKYRTFKRTEIERIQEIGDKLVKFLTTIEAGIGEQHKAFVKSDAFRTLNSGVEGEFAAKLAEAEAAGECHRHLDRREMVWAPLVCVQRPVLTGVAPLIFCYSTFLFFPLFSKRCCLSVRVTQCWRRWARRWPPCRRRPPLRPLLLRRLPVGRAKARQRRACRSCCGRPERRRPCWSRFGAPRWPARAAEVRHASYALWVERAVMR